MIDVHAHFLPSFYRDALEAAGRRPAIAGGFPAWSLEAAAALMERTGISRTILSLSTPGAHLGDDGQARELSRRCNEYLAGLDRARFGGFAVMPLPDVEGAVAEVAYALDTLKLEGVGLLASYGETFLGNPRFDPVMAALDQRNAIVFVHPSLHPSAQALDVAYPRWMVEYPIDTTRAAVNLVFSGTLDRFPRIRFILAHCGGTLPYLSWRLAAAPLIDQRFRDESSDAIRSKLARFYVETAQAPGEAALGPVLGLNGPDKIMFGSDWPYCPPAALQAMVETLREATAEPSPLYDAISFGNATALFNDPPSTHRVHGRD